MSNIVGGATLYAKSLEQVARFYTEVCGLTPTARAKEFIVLERGALQLVVVEIPEPIARSIEIANPPIRREDSPHKLTFVVESIAISRSVAAALGGVIDPKEREWQFQGTLVCDGHDPEGNVIQVRENLL